MGIPMHLSSTLKLLLTAVPLLILPLQAHGLAPDQVFDRVKDAIVVVKTHTAKGKVREQGSGVLLPSGLIATSCHVVVGGATYQVVQGEQTVAATLYAQDRDKDICLLAATGFAGKPAQLGAAAGLKVGAAVYAVGAPKGLELSLSNGIVSQLRGGPPPMIQTTAAISPGSSGGGLFDDQGRLVGLTTLYLRDGQNLNFAMPVEWIDQVVAGKKTTRSNPGQGPWVQRAVALEKAQKWEEMLAWCQQWTGKEPQSAAAWYSLGNAYGNLNRHQEAIDAYRQALKIRPNDAKVWCNLGAAFNTLKRHDEAIDGYRQALKIDPADAVTWNNLGNAYGDLKRHDEAIEAYRQALKIRPDYAEAWCNLGKTYTDLKRHDQAIETYRQALTIRPDSVEAWYNLGISYLVTKDKTAALEAAQKLQPLDPERAEALFNLVVPR